MSSKTINGDCLEEMKKYPKNYFSIAVVDPPYGIKAPKMSMGSNPNRNGRDKRGEKQYGGISTSKKLGISDWDNNVPTDEYFQELFRVSKNQIIWGGNYFDLPPTRGIVCWDKKQNWKAFSQWEMAWTSFNCPAKLFSFSSRGGNNKEPKIHPTQKPVQLYAWLFDTFAKSGDCILDTHLGSGSSRIAAYEKGYNFLGTEKDLKYFEAQENRFKKYLNSKI